jgi:hypothetical protein
MTNDDLRDQFQQRAELKNELSQLKQELAKIGQNLVHYGNILCSDRPDRFVPRLDMPLYTQDQILGKVARYQQLSFEIGRLNITLPS